MNNISCGNTVSAKLGLDAPLLQPQELHNLNIFLKIQRKSTIQKPYSWHAVAFFGLWFFGVFFPKSLPHVTIFCIFLYLGDHCGTALDGEVNSPAWYNTKSMKALWWWMWFLKETRSAKPRVSGTFLKQYGLQTLCKAELSSLWGKIFCFFLLELWFAWGKKWRAGCLNNFS